MEQSTLSAAVHCVNLRAALRTAMRSAWLILLAAVIGFCGTYICPKTLVPESYTSTCTMMVSPKNTTAFSNSLGATTNIQTQLTALLATDSMKTAYRLGEYHAEFSVTIPNFSVNIVAVSATADTPQHAYEAVEAVRTLAMDNMNTTRVLTVVDQPMIPEKRSSGLKRGCAVGAVAGAALMFLILLAMALMHDRVDTPDAVPVKLDMNCLTVLPNGTPNPALRAWDGNFDKSVLTLRRICAEQLKNGAHVLLFAETEKNEGCVTAAISAAMALAETGRQVLLMDCDMRSPHVLSRLGLTASENDLAAYLAEGAPLDPPQAYGWQDAEGRKQSIGVLGVSHASEAAADCLSSASMRELMDTCRLGDVVILVGAPLYHCSDTEILATYADAAFLVAEQSAAPVRHINAAADALDRTTQLLGCIFRTAENRDRRSLHE